ncbi:MAG: hypothetical protein KAV25_07950 [Methanophagales archaeon]|nr:hypothetical protein [Methanophagales archaeon]
MKRRKVVVGISIACLCIAAIAIQAAFGGGIGLRIDPPVITVKPGSTITYDVTLSSYDPDCVDITVIPYTCKKEWFEWTEMERVCVAARGKTQISLDVTPTDKGNFQFKVKAVSKSNPESFATDNALINSEPPPTLNRKPKCIGLMSNLPEPQKIMTKYGTTEIKWTAFACDPDEDQISYRFCLKGPGTGGTEQVVQDWSTSNKWTWPATLNDWGNSTIYVDVRDSYGDDINYSCVYENYHITMNQPPCCACLVPDKFSPRYSGTEITWSACAIDPEGDQDTLWYRFWLKKGEGDWKIKRNWDTSNTWKWTPTDPGDYKIRVWIRDSLVPISEDPEYKDVSATFKNYKIFYI